MTVQQYGPGSTVDIDLKSGPLGLGISSGTVGPPGLQGPAGPPGTPASSTLIIGGFSHRDPSELPESGLIPADWDEPGNPPRDFQMTIGNSLVYRPTQHLWQFVYFSGDLLVPWLELDPIQGPPGEQGEQGDRGPEGPPGQQGNTGPQGVPGPQGTQGPQGNTGPQGIPGGTGATGPTGPTGPPGTPGAQGDKGDAGEKGDQGERGDVGPPGQDGADYDETRITNVEASVAVHTGQIGVLTGQMGMLQGDVAALTSRVAALEALVRPIVIADRTTDVAMDTDNFDYLFQSVPLGAGTHIVSATFTIDLTPVTATSKVVTFWMESTGPPPTGQRSTQVTLHQALPVTSVNIGPARFEMPTPGNVVLHAVIAPPPGSGGAPGTVTIRARTVQTDFAGASSVIST